MKYDFNQQNMTLTVSTSFLKKAGKYNSPEYNLIKRLRADNPSLTVEVAKKQKSSRAKRTYQQMEDWITDVDANALPLFEKVKRLSKVQRSPYNYVRAWFENRYSDYINGGEISDDGEERQRQELISQVQSKLTTTEEEAA